jgi:uncharacterized protein (TIGR02145 family)
MGITLLKRAGADNGNWPMLRTSGHIALESNTEGFVITRNTTAQINAITDPVEGMMVYDTDEKCLKIYDGTAWKCFSTPACPETCTVPTTPGAISFSTLPTNLNDSDTFTASIAPVAGATSYVWTLPSGLTGTSTSTSITITVDLPGLYDESSITVKAVNDCGESNPVAGTDSFCVIKPRMDIPESVYIGGNYWSTKNVDAPNTLVDNAWGAGMFYQWDFNIGWSSTNPLTSAPSGQTWNPNNFSFANTWNMTNNNPCPAGWIVPDKTAIDNLIAATSVWITPEQAVQLGLGDDCSPFPGRIYGTTTVPETWNDFDSNTMLFFPEVGYRNASGTFFYPGVRYWSSTAVNLVSAYSLFFYQDVELTQGGYAKTNAYNVRCVKP